MPEVRILNYNKFVSSLKRILWYFPNSSGAPRPQGAAGH